MKAIALSALAVLLATPARADDNNKVVTLKRQADLRQAMVPRRAFQAYMQAWKSAACSLGLAALCEQSTRGEMKAEEMANATEADPATGNRTECEGLFVLYMAQFKAADDLVAWVDKNPAPSDNEMKQSFRTLLLEAARTLRGPGAELVNDRAKQAGCVVERAR